MILAVVVDELAHAPCSVGLLALGLSLTDDEIAEEVEKVGGGCPSRNTIRLWRETFAEDPDWYPGKQSSDCKKSGRKKTITAQQEATLAKSAMALKAHGVEPTAAAVKAQAPVAHLQWVGQPAHSMW